MPKPNQPTILHHAFVDWARALTVEVDPVTEVEDDTYAYPERFAYLAEVASASGDWQYGGTFTETSFVVPLGTLEDERIVRLRVFALYDGEAGAPAVVEGILSPRGFSVARRPTETYLRPGAYPHRGPIDSQAMLDDFRDFAASNEALYQRIATVSEVLEEWVTTNTTELDLAKRVIRGMEDQKHE